MTIDDRTVHVPGEQVDPGRQPSRTSAATPAAVAGDMPPEMKSPIDTDIWQPLVPAVDGEMRDRRTLNAFGVAREHVSVAEAQAEMRIARPGDRGRSVEWPRRQQAVDRFERQAGADAECVGQAEPDAGRGLRLGPWCGIRDGARGGVLSLARRVRRAGLQICAQEPRQLEISPDPNSPRF